MENKQIIPMLKRWTKIILGKSAAAFNKALVVVTIKMKLEDTIMI